MKILVIGDGPLGNAIACRCRKKGWAVHQTSRKNTELLQLDLSGQPDFSQLVRTDWTVIAAGISGYRQCTEDPLAQLVNVDKTLELCAERLKLGSSVLFASSTAVFDGSSRFPGPLHPPSPDTAYGHQKKSVEDYLLQYEKTAVVRFSKLLDADNRLISQWLDKLSAGQDIKAFSDLNMAPVLFKHAAEISCRIMEAGLGGIFHCSGPEEISYYDFARHICVQGKFDSNLVRKNLCKNVLDYCPAHSSLNSTATEKSLGLHLPAPETVVKNIIASHNQKDAK